MALVMGIFRAHAMRLKVQLCCWLNSGVYAIFSSFKANLVVCLLKSFGRQCFCTHCSKYLLSLFQTGYRFRKQGIRFPGYWLGRLDLMGMILDQMTLYSSFTHLWALRILLISEAFLIFQISSGSQSISSQP